MVFHSHAHSCVCEFAVLTYIWNPVYVFGPYPYVIRGALFFAATLLVLSSSDS